MIYDTKESGYKVKDSGKIDNIDIKECKKYKSEMAAGYRKEISVLRYKCILDKVEESYLFEKIEHVVSVRGMRKVGKRCIASIDISFVP